MDIDQLTNRDQAMTEIHFIVEDAPEGGYLARAVGADIFTEADDLDRPARAGPRCRAMSLRSRPEGRALSVYISPARRSIAA